MAQEVKAWNNGIVEDQAGSTLPTVNSDDNGKVLQVVDGQWDKGGQLPEAELPAPSSTNNGKIAKVVSDGEGGYIWGAENETQELPAVESTDINKLVGVVSDGASGAEYGLVSAPQGFKRFVATIEYDSDSSKYYYMKNGQKSTAQQFAVDVQGYDEVVIKLVGVPESAAFDPDVFIYQMRSLDGQTLTAFRADFCNCIYNGDYTFYVNIVVYYNETESNDYVMVTIE